VKTIEIKTESVQGSPSKEPTNYDIWKLEMDTKHPSLRYWRKLFSAIAWVETRLIYRPWRWIGIRKGWIDEEDWGIGV